jgi:hypothetical protein
MHGADYVAALGPKKQEDEQFLHRATHKTKVADEILLGASDFSIVKRTLNLSHNSASHYSHSGKKKSPGVSRGGPAGAELY